MQNTENYTVDGVEFNSQGKKVAYWIYDHHPLFFQTVSRRIDAEDVIHLYEVLRPGQVRGVPFGVSAMLRLRDFDEYEDAQLLRQKIAACYAAFIYDAGEMADIGAGKDDDLLPDALEPGGVHRMPPGTRVEFGNPPGAEGYTDYSRNILLAISAAYGVPYEALTNDFSNVNFSSARMSWLEFNRNVVRWQKQILIPRFCQKVWDWFNQYAVIEGAASTPAGLIQWTPPRREMIDPAKELAAQTDAVRAGLMTWPEAVRANGYEPDAQIAEIAEYNKKMDEAGVMVVTDGRLFPTKTGPASDPAEDPADGGGDTSAQATAKKKPTTVKRPQGGGTQAS
jgi:lambda family phage portal protein